MGKLLSIIVPSYNMEKYLPKCLGSLIVDDVALLQLLDVIVVNDGSKDRTSEIAHVFNQKYPGVFQVIDKENGHYGSCINAGLAAARGTYVRTLDADDSYDTQAFAEFVKRLQQIDVVDLFVTDMCTVDADGRVFSKGTFTFPVNQRTVLDELVKVDRSCICHFSICYRTQMLRDMGYRQSEGLPHTDMQWSMIPMLNVNSVIYMPLCIYRYLVGRDGQSMAPKEVCAQIDKQAKVALSVYREFVSSESNGKSANPLFWHQTLLDSVVWISRIYAIGYGDAVPTSTGEWFDLSVKELLPEIYREASVASTGRIYRFYFIKEWRKGYTRKTIGYALYRSYRRCVDFARFLSGKRKR